MLKSLIYTRWTTCPARSNPFAGHFQNLPDMSGESGEFRILCGVTYNKISVMIKLNELILCSSAKYALLKNYLCQDRCLAWHSIDQKAGPNMVDI